MPPSPQPSTTIHTLPSGEKVASSSLATSSRWTDRKTGEQRKATEWNRIIAWGGNVSHCERIAKGSRVHVEGRLKTRKWKDVQGNARSTTKVVAHRVVHESFLGSFRGLPQYALKPIITYSLTRSTQARQGSVLSHRNPHGPTFTGRQVKWICGR